jgi:glycerol kinase
MNLQTLEWDDDLLDLMEIPRQVLPEIRSSSEVYGRAVGDLAGVPVAGVLGDQQASRCSSKPTSSALPWRSPPPPR